MLPTKHRIWLLALLAASFAAIWSLQAHPIWNTRHERGASGLRGRHWRQMSATETRPAVDSIQRQLDAFQRGDWTRAAAYQSHDLLRHFGSIQAFRAAMTTRYPEFLNYQSVRFGPARANRAKTRVIIPVILTGRDSVRVNAIYSLVREAGGLKVDGVETQPTTDAPPTPV